jgi:ketosteroid isomerase-like protein
MSQNNISVLIDGYDAYARRDIAGVLSVFADDIEWHVPDSIPFGGDYRGHGGVTAFFGRLAEYFSELSVEPQEFIDGGDAIAARVRVSGTGVGGSFVLESLHLWRLRDGKVASFTEYADTARQLQAIGEPSAAPVRKPRLPLRAGRA